MLKSSSAGSTSSSLSRSGSGSSSLSRLKRESRQTGSGKGNERNGSPSSGRISKAETHADFTEECKYVYLSVFDSTDEDITSAEEFLLCKLEFIPELHSF